MPKRESFAKAFGSIAIAPNTNFVGTIQNYGACYLRSLIQSLRCRNGLNSCGAAFDIVPLSMHSYRMQLARRALMAIPMPNLALNRTRMRRPSFRGSARAG